MLIGENIRLRAIEKSDAILCARWLNDPEVIQYLYMNSPLSLAKEEQWFDAQIKKSPLEGEVFAIEVLENGEWIHVGNTGLDKVEPINGQAEFGIFIGEKAFWNKGVGKEAARIIVKHGFEDLNLNRVYLYVFEENKRAISAYNAVGFIQEGLLRKAVYKNGHFNNMLIMSILHAEWRG